MGASHALIAGEGNSSHQFLGGQKYPFWLQVNKYDDSAKLAPGILQNSVECSLLLILLYLSSRWTLVRTSHKINDIDL